MTYDFDALPYPIDSLEPFIDKATMDIHYNKHHRTYYNNFIKAVEGTPYDGWTLEKIFKEIANLSPAIRNSGGGYYNHNFFWKCISPSGKRTPTEKLAAQIEKKFGNYQTLKVALNSAGLSVFGSGFVWLIALPDKSLEVTTTPNQNNPLMGDASVQGLPLMAIDVWEHAYYLRYQNKRADYLEAFWNVVDWTQATKIYENLTA